MTEPVLATDGVETERWFKETAHGHAIPAELWDEWERLWTRIDELTDTFYNCPWVDNRPPREPTVFDRYMRPQITFDIMKAVQIHNDYQNYRKS